MWRDVTIPVVRYRHSVKTNRKESGQFYAKIRIKMSHGAVHLFFLFIEHEQQLTRLKAQDNQYKPKCSTTVPQKCWFFKVLFKLCETPLQPQTGKSSSPWVYWGWKQPLSGFVHILHTRERKASPPHASLALTRQRETADKSSCLLEKPGFTHLFSCLQYLLPIVPLEKRSRYEISEENSEACGDHKPLKQLFLPPDAGCTISDFQPIFDNYRATILAHIQ